MNKVTKRTIRIELLDHLMNLAAIKFQDADNPDGFLLKLHETYPDAPRSPIFLNLRDVNNPKQGTLDDLAYLWAAILMYDLVVEQELWFDALAALPNAGDPFATAIAELGTLPAVRDYWPNGAHPSEDIPLVELRKETYEDGTRKILAPLEPVEPGTRVLLVDDLITQGGSKKEAIEALQAQGAVIVAIIVLVDREQGGIEEMRELGVEVYSVYELKNMLAYYKGVKRLSPEMYDTILSYLAAAN